MARMLKFSLLLCILALSLYAEIEKNVCKEADKVIQEAKVIYEKFNDAKNALLLLNGGEFRRIIGAKPACMDDATYMRYLDQYAFYASKIEEYNSAKQIETLSKQHPDHIYFYQLLGDAYKKDYVKHNNAKLRDLALESYRRYIELSKQQHQTIDKDIVEFVKSNGLIKAQNTWGKQLNIAGDVPTNAFKAFYIDTNNPQKVVASETVKDISVNYAYKDFHNIDSGHFGGYWVGNVVFQQDEKKVFSISLSNSKIRLIVDGYVLYEGQSRAEVPFTFTKGTHKIEVEYLNGWHTTSLVVKILPHIQKYAQQELKERLKYLENRDFSFWYVGIYESKNKDNSVVLSLQKSNKPVVLLLQSYEATTWKIKNPYHTKIEAIVINSSAPEATIEGEIDQNITVLYSQSKIGQGYRLTPQCSCISGNFHCEGGNFTSNAFATSINNKKVSGFSGQYSAAELAVPQEIMDDAHYAQIEKQNQEIEAQRQTCSKNKNENFDTIFKK